MESKHTTPVAMSSRAAVNWMLATVAYTAIQLTHNIIGAVVGPWANQVSHPSYGVTKEYVVTTNQPANKKQLKDLEQGCTIEGVEVKPVGIAVEMSDPTKRNKLRIVIAEGKNREVTIHYLAVVSLQCHAYEAVW